MPVYASTIRIQSIDAWSGAAAWRPRRKTRRQPAHAQRQLDHLVPVARMDEHGGIRPAETPPRRARSCRALLPRRHRQAPSGRSTTNRTVSAAPSEAVRIRLRRRTPSQAGSVSYSAMKRNRARRSRQTGERVGDRPRPASRRCVVRATSPRSSSARCSSYASQDSHAGSGQRRAVASVRSTGPPPLLMLDLRLFACHVTFPPTQRRSDDPRVAETTGPAPRRATETAGRRCWPKTTTLPHPYKAPAAGDFEANLAVRRRAGNRCRWSILERHPPSSAVHISHELEAHVVGLDRICSDDESVFLKMDQVDVFLSSYLRGALLDPDVAVVLVLLAAAGGGMVSSRGGRP